MDRLERAVSKTRLYTTVVSCGWGELRLCTTDGGTGIGLARLAGPLHKTYAPLPRRSYKRLQAKLYRQR